MSDHQHEEHAVEDLDVPESETEKIKGGLKLSPERSVKIEIDYSASNFS
jgi:hypothetical protein